ncbi:MAG: calcium-binding protein [Synechocystis sp.]
MANITGTVFDDNGILRPVLNGTAVADTIDGLAGNDILNGLAGNDVLNGGTGNDTLDGGSGADTMDGGDGDDLYIVDNVGDIVKELFDDTTGGVDTVNASVSYSLAPGTSGNQGFGIENLTLTGITNINGTGNVKNNIITGNSGNNILNGGAGNDTLTGGLGNDTLDGGSGADTMNGGDGNDLYIVDNVGDIVRESFDDTIGGVDTVNASVSYSLAPGTSGNQGFGIENLTLTGIANINGTGNAKSNIITGNSGNNILTGGDGHDTLNGGAGNDTLVGGAGVDILNGGDGNDTITSDGDGGTYKGDAGNDTIFSGLGQETIDGGIGIDTINHSAFGGDYVFNMITGLTNFSTSLFVESFINFENAIMGAGNDTVTGNALANVISGGAGNDTLNGDAGNDSLNGGIGNDALTGGLGVDILTGDAGDDILVGGAGVDILTGGAGNDKFRFNSFAEGVDIIKDFAFVAGNTDKIEVSASGFGATNLTQFSYNSLTGALFFLGNQFATVENKPAGFSVSLDVVLI